MGKKLDAVMGRNFRTSKFKTLVGLAISRLAVLKNQRQVRCNQARSDVVQLLQQGHHERALLRVELVIKDQNMLDAYVMMEGYCNLLLERIHLIEQESECPDELKESISTLIFGSTRCGDFPELQEIREVFVSKYGKEFAARATELRNNCGVSSKIVQKLSTRQSDQESRMKALQEIARDNSIALPMNEAYASTTEGNMEANKMQNPPKPEEPTNSIRSKLVENLLLPQDLEKDRFSDSLKAKKKYKDVADAAQAAFESAAYAAAAARAAVELSRSDSHDPDNQKSNSQGRKASVKTDHVESEKKDVHHENEATKSKGDCTAELKVSASNSGSGDEELNVITISPDVQDITQRLEKDMVFDKSDDNTHKLGLNINPTKLSSEVSKIEEPNQKIPPVIQAGLKVDSGLGDGSSMGHDAEGSKFKLSHLFRRKKGPCSVQPRQVRGY